MFASISARVEKIVTRLKSVGSIKAGQYWCTYTGSPQKQGHTTSVLRTFYYANECRDMNMTDIDECFATAFQILEDICSECKTVAQLMQYTTLIENIKTALFGSKDGISNLKVTYHDDELATDRLKALSEGLSGRYSEIEKRFALISQNQDG